MKQFTISLFLMLMSFTVSAGPQVHFRDWQRQCEQLPAGDQSCHILQQVFNPETGALAMRMQVGFTPQRQPLLLVTLPLGVALRPGVLMRVDGKEPWLVRFDVCAGDGCRAAEILQADQLRAMKRGSKAVLTIADLSGRKIAVPLSLLGFTRAYASISQ